MINFKIIVPFYNVEKWIKLTATSIISQKYENFSCYFSDDMSTDKSVDILKTIPSFKINVIENKEKKFSLKNIYDTIIYSNPSDEDVIVIVDGDDWLPHENVLNRLNEEYSNNDIYLTYGSYIEYPSGKYGEYCTNYSDEVIKNNMYRNDIWRASHLRTFKYKLWKNINKKDLCDENGNFYKMTGDLAMMFPMLEMCRGKFKFIKDILYCYNVSNPINDHKVDALLQQKYDQEIRNKNKY